MIEETISLLKKAEICKNTIAVEGVPFSGKSSYIKRNLNNHCHILYEHMLYDKNPPSIIYENWDNNNPNAVLARQKYFLDCEKSRWDEAKSFPHPVFDRSVLSIIGYFYARTFDDNNTELKSDFLNLCHNYFSMKKITLPEKIIYLYAPYPTILSRIGNNSRKCEDFLLKESTFNHLCNFYEKVFSGISDKINIVKKENYA